MSIFNRFLGLTRYSWLMIVTILAAAAVIFFYLEVTWVAVGLIIVAAGGAIMTYGRRG